MRYSAESSYIIYIGVVHGPPSLCEGDLLSQCEIYIFLRKKRRREFRNSRRFSNGFVIRDYKARRRLDGGDGREAFTRASESKTGMSALYGRVTPAKKKRNTLAPRVRTELARERVSSEKERCDKQQEGQRVKEDISWKQTASFSRFYFPSLAKDFSFIFFSPGFSQVLLPLQTV